MLNKITRLKAWLRNMEANIQEINSRLSGMEAGYRHDSEEKNAVFRECWSALDARNGLLQARVDNIEALLRQIINENRQNTGRQVEATNNSTSALYTLLNIQRINASKDIYLGLAKRLQSRVPVGIDLIRVGSGCDGGYVMADCFSTANTAISLGISDDVSWDLEMANRGIKVLQFDPSIDFLPEDHPNFEWQKLGICGSRQLIPRPLNFRFITLHDALAGADPEDNNLILKMDIEGFEYEVFPDSFDILPRFEQIVVEFHCLDDPAYALAASSILDEIERTHQLIHVHANNYGVEIAVDGLIMASVLELTFLRMEGHEFSRESTAPKHVLDKANNGKIREFLLKL